jgi:hypothetical protein
MGEFDLFYGQQPDEAWWGWKFYNVSSSLRYDGGE